MQLMKPYFKPEPADVIWTFSKYDAIHDVETQYLTIHGVWMAITDSKQYETNQHLVEHNPSSTIWLNELVITALHQHDKLKDGRMYINCEMDLKGFGGELHLKRVQDDPHPYTP